MASSVRGSRAGAVSVKASFLSELVQRDHFRLVGGGGRQRRSSVGWLGFRFRLRRRGRGGLGLGHVEPQRVLDAGIDEAGDRRIWNREALLLAGEPERDREKRLARREVPELVLQDDRHLVGIEGQNLGRA